MLGLVKIVILGEGGVGKSCVTVQFVQNYFVLDYDPTIENSYRKQMYIGDDTLVMLDITDTAGQEEHAVMRDTYIYSGGGFIVAYSITCERSFRALETYIEKIRYIREDLPPVLIVGNKCDLENDRRVSIDQGYEYACQCGYAFYEISAKIRINIEEIFVDCANQVWANKMSYEHPSPGSMPVTHRRFHAK